MKKLSMFGLIVMLALTTACAPRQGDKGDTGGVGPAGPAAPVPTPAPVDEVQQDIDALIKDENDYRLGLGQTALTAGLSCSVQKVNSGQCLSSASTAQGCNSGNVINTSGNTLYTYLYKGNFNQLNSSGTDANLLLPTALRSMFAGQNFVIKCSGQIVVRETDYYDFSVESDDGSLLSVDGAQVVNNDNNHGMTIRTGNKFLRRGVRAFSLQYAQTGGGNYGLVLLAGGELVDAKYYFH